MGRERKDCRDTAIGRLEHLRGMLSYSEILPELSSDPDGVDTKSSA